MNSSDLYPKLPLWVFFATDLSLIGAGTAIAVWSSHPLATSSIIWIVVCVALGAIVALLPLVARYERQKNEILDERQRALEALASTVASSAEQISIAASGLHQIAELASKNVKMAEHLPHKLQDKMAEFQALLASATDTEKEELERELLALRTSESERLESVSQRIAKLSAEWTKLEAATHEHLTAANDAVAKLGFSTASAIGQAQAAAGQALGQARVEAARALGEASGQATVAMESAKNAALAGLDARVASAAAMIVERVVRELNASLGRRESESEIRSHASRSPGESLHPSEPLSTRRSTAGSGSRDPGANAAAPALKDESETVAAKRPRKVRREDSSPVQNDPASADVAPRPEASDTPTAAPPATSADIPGPGLPDEPQPVPAAQIVEITPIAPDTPEPFSYHGPSASNGMPPARAMPTNEAEAPAGASARAPRRRPPQEADRDDEPGLALELDDTSGAGSPGAGSERVLTSDGATRLLVTAYIGIGNRLFIRGAGPGLSWDKGVPLQFVSIGKWRWETPDASAPVQFKLYKNDDMECSALGTQSLDPGHQQEVTAAF